MSGEALDRLRAGFAARPAVAPAGHTCPDPGQIFDAACGRLTADERRAIVGAVAACGRCAEAWRLAVEVARDATPAEVATAAGAGRPEAGAVTRARRPRWVAPAFAAAMAAARVIIVMAWRGGGETREGGSELRGGEPGAVKALVSDGATLARDAFELRWTAAPEGRYVLSVFTADLAPLHVSPELADPQHRVPAAALAGVAAGVALFWRVDVVLRDGRRVPSATYRVIVR